MTDVNSKEAIVLAYLARHTEITATERNRLIAILHGPAQELATKLTAEPVDRSEPERVQVAKRSATKVASKKRKSKTGSKARLVRETKAVAV